MIAAVVLGCIAGIEMPNENLSERDPKPQICRPAFKA